MISLQALDLKIPIVFDGKLYKKILKSYCVAEDFQEEHLTVTWKKLKQEELDNILRQMEYHIHNSLQNHGAFSTLIRSVRRLGYCPKFNYEKEFIISQCEVVQNESE